jgi:hypothetical protein
MDTQEKVENQRVVYFIAAALAVVVVGSAYLGYRHRVLAPKRLEAATRTWFDSPRVLSQVLLDRYGPPNVIAPQAATWYERQPWKRITVHGDSPDKYLENTVGYLAKPAAVAALREFGQDIRLDLVQEEISARSNAEALNYLALNLADDVASGKRSPKQARSFYLRTIKLAASGKSSPYMERLLFEPHRFVPQERMPNLIGY